MKNVIPFLEELSKNNSREWFHDNKGRYSVARKEFESFVAALIPRLAEIDPELTGLDPKQCIFRIHRDVRFSPDKSPYKTNMGAAMGRGGRKSPYASYYIHIEPGNSFAGGGIWMPQPPALKAMREEIYYNLDEFRAIVEGRDFARTFTEFMGERLKRPPRDFPADFPGIGWLQYKSYAVGHFFDDDVVSSGNFTDRVLDVFGVLLPFNRFINRALSGD